LSYAPQMPKRARCPGETQERHVRGKYW